MELILKDSGNREIAICKELTKINETIFRGNLKNIIEAIENNKVNLRGEFTVVVGSEGKKQNKSINKTIITQTSNLLKKNTLTETVEIVHKLTKISKNDIYQMALKLKNG